MEKLFVFYILLSYFSSHQGNPFSSLVLGGILTHFHLLIIFTCFNICAHSAGFDGEPISHAKNLTVMRWEGREGKEVAVSSRILTHGHGQTQNVSRLRPMSPLAPHHLICKSSLSQFPSHSVVSLPKASIWKCIHLHFCSIRYHLAPC